MVAAQGGLASWWTPLTGSAAEPWRAPLAVHLGPAQGPDDERRNRRFAVASRLAGLFAAYASQRPQILREWADGQDTDGAGSPVPADPRPGSRCCGVRCATRSAPPARPSVWHGPTPSLGRDPHVVESARATVGLRRQSTAGRPTACPSSLWERTGRYTRGWADASPSMWAELPQGNEPSARRHIGHGSRRTRCCALWAAMPTS